MLRNLPLGHVSGDFRGRLGLWRRGDQDTRDRGADLPQMRMQGLERVA